jgi:molecular chaperone GrpE
MAEDQSARPTDDEQAATDADVEGKEALTAALAAARDAEAQARDQMLRAQAEAENVRRRSQREIENAQKYAIEKFVADLLPVADSLERAVEIARANKTDEAAAIAEGVELSLKLFLDVLGRAAVVQIDPHGEPFNPQYHEAMSTVESDAAEPGSVVAVLQKGYTLHGRLVRAARVMVARAPA